MSNRLKFRVWDNINKRYEKDLTLIDKDGDLCYQDGGRYCNGEHPEDFTIEQCTGLTDKTGKLIFEGDVLLFNGSLNPVYFDDGSFVVLHPGSVFVPIKQKHTDFFEIIGNVHEMEV